MAARIKTITLKNINTKDFAETLRRLGAQPEARTWARGRTLAWMWENCERGDWMWRLLIRADTIYPGWPTWAELTKLLEKYYCLSTGGLRDWRKESARDADFLRRYIKIKK